MQNSNYDVVVVGASVAGSAAATFFGQAGLRVALVERSRDINAYKKVCTHYLQPFAVPVLKELGVLPTLEKAGAVPNGSRVWTKWGWFGPGVSGKKHGYNIRRETLDPLLRNYAAATPGVDLYLGTAVRDLIFENERVAGIKATTENKKVVELHARLVVGADGRYSRTAKMANVPQTVEANNRFIYFGYYRNLKLATGKASQVWYHEDLMAYALHNDDDLTLMALMLPKSQLAEFKKDVAGNFQRLFNNLPNSPNLHCAELEGDLIGMIDMPNVSRQAAVPGLALIGDAALASDPVWGNGMAWALRAAQWLTDSTSNALAIGETGVIDEALETYRQKHEASLADRFTRDSDFAQVRPFNWLERLFYAAAVQDIRFAKFTGPHSTRLTNIQAWPPAKAIAAAAWTLFKNKRKSSDSLTQIPVIPSQANG